MSSGPGSGPNPALAGKYGAEKLAAMHSAPQARVEEKLALRDAVDQNFAQLWLDLAAGLERRPALDLRTRHLVRVGQYTMSRSHRHLEDTLRAALADGVAPREIAEVILHTTIYGGETVSEPALDLFARIAAETGALAGLRADQLPLDGHDRERSLPSEEAQWHARDKADPRRAPLMERYGWLAVSAGLRLRPTHHLNVLSYLDALDPDFAGLWVTFVYQGMYSRNVLDDRTRMLCLVGNLVAIAETVQLREHFSGALRAGASPREVMEVVLSSCVGYGMPAMLGSLRLFVEVIKEQGRLGEIGNPPGF